MARQKKIVTANTKDIEKQKQNVKQNEKHAESDKETQRKKETKEDRNNKYIKDETLDLTNKGNQKHIIKQTHL